ncbi:MAG TPA: MFS transporter [Haloplasmataceae bacterium]
MEEKKIKLNFWRVTFVGFAFFIIQSFWNSYDNVVPPLLKNKFGMTQEFRSGFFMSLDNIIALLFIPLFGALSDRVRTKIGRRTPFIIVGTLVSAISYVLLTMIHQLWLFVIVLLLTLLSMALFRSPAVALMPDVTVKPLRSKANAIINLMGTFAAMVVLILGRIYNTAQEGKTDFTAYVFAVSIVMIVSLIIFLLVVREVKWAKEMQELTDKYKLDAESEERKEHGGKLSKRQLISLIFLLTSVALWFTGYNAVRSKYSLYAPNVLKQDFNISLLIAYVAGALAFLPVGIVASKIGRKKTVLGGIVVLSLGFFFAIFANEHTPEWVMYILFTLVGVGWATINVNSYPMVVELAYGSDVGKYTGYYYTASMVAQIITPMLSGAIMDFFGSYRPLFPYATIFVGASFITMLFVKHGDVKTIDLTDYEDYDL